MTRCLEDEASEVTPEVVAAGRLFLRTGEFRFDGGASLFPPPSPLLPPPLPLPLPPQKAAEVADVGVVKDEGS